MKKKIAILFVFIIVLGSMSCLATDTEITFAAAADTFASTINYQDIIDVIVTMFKVALPLGVVFNVSEWILTTFFKMAFPRKYGDF